MTQTRSSAGPGSNGRRKRGRPLRPGPRHREPVQGDLLPPSPEDGTVRRFLEEAVRCFGTHGYYGVSVREIAEGVGVKPSALYAHLPSKEAVLERIMAIAHDYFGQCLFDAAAAADGPDERLRAVVKANVRFHATYPRLAMVANHELRALSADALAKIVRQRASWEELVQEVIREGNDRGVFTCPDPALGAKALGGMCIRVAAWIEQDPEMDVDQIAEFYADFVLGALRSGLQTEVVA